MKDKKIIQSLKVTILGILVGVGFSYAFAQWTPPTGSPSPANNAAAPINVSATPQAKGGLVMSISNPPLLDIKGTLSSNTLAVWGNSIFNGNITVNGLNNTGQTTKPVCIDNTGKLIICAS